MKFKLIASIALGIAGTMLNPAIAGNNGGKTYEITITNLTAGQPFTPPVLVTHSNRTGIFAVGEPASAEIQAIAENGNNSPLLTSLASNPYVLDIVEGTAPILPANDPAGTGFASTVTYRITTRGSATHLSFVNMLICTNDGFTGIDSVSLPSRTKTVYTRAYDARTEQNTEDFADMVPPCQGLIGVATGEAGTGASNPAIAEAGVVIPHVGVIGDADLVRSVHDWSDPVAKVVVKRVRR